MNPLLAQAEGLKIAATGLLIVSVLIGAYNFGRHVKDGEVAKERLQQAQQIEALQEDRQAKADELALLNAARRAETAPREKLITREVLRYVDVTPPADRCTLHGTWRVRHDAAATGLPLAPESGSLAPGTLAPIEDAAALETVADNYAAARECAEKLAGWQRRYRALELKQP